MQQVTEAFLTIDNSLARKPIHQPRALRIHFAALATALIASTLLGGFAYAQQPVGDNGIAALTHHLDGSGKQVTYRSPVTSTLTPADVPEGVWTLDESQTTVLCFEDGNNAVFFTIGGDFYAANGKARQFVDYDGGDGILLQSGERRQVRELAGGKHADLRNAVIGAGLKLCGRKSLEDVAQNVEAASDEPELSPKQANLLTAAIGIRGAELCRFKLDEVAVVDHLQANGIDLETFNAEIPIYSLVVTKMFADVGEKDFCHTVLLPQFGPGGKKFVSEQ